SWKTQPMTRSARQLRSTTASPTRSGTSLAMQPPLDIWGVPLIRAYRLAKFLDTPHARRAWEGNMTEPTEPTQPPKKEMVVEIFGGAVGPRVELSDGDSGALGITPARW